MTFFHFEQIHMLRLSFKLFHSNQTDFIAKIRNKFKLFLNKKQLIKTTFNYKDLLTIHFWLN